MVPSDKRAFQYGFSEAGTAAFVRCVSFEDKPANADFAKDVGAEANREREMISAAVAKVRTSRAKVHCPQRWV